MATLYSFDLVIRLSVLVPPPLQPQTPTRLPSTHGCVLSQRMPATRSAVSPAPGLAANVFSSVLLIAVAARLSIATAMQPLLASTLSNRVSFCHASLTVGAEGPPYTWSITG